MGRGQHRRPAAGQGRVAAAPEILGEEAEVSIFTVLDKLFLKGAIRAAG